MNHGRSSLFVVIVFLSSCRQDQWTDQSFAGSSGAAVMASNGEPASTQLPDISPLVFPQVFSGAEFDEAGKEAAKQSDAQDAKCAFMNISPTLLAYRPEGLGCPRPELSTVAEIQE